MRSDAAAATTSVGCRLHLTPAVFHALDHDIGVADDADHLAVLDHRGAVELIALEQACAQRISMSGSMPINGLFMIS